MGVAKVSILHNVHAPQSNIHNQSRTAISSYTGLFFTHFLLNAKLKTKARIMAAQERAKNAQLKQAPTSPTSVDFEKEKMMNALNGLSNVAPKKPA